MKIYLVGGAVRDLFLNKKPNDLDYAVEANSYDEMKQFLLNNKFTIYAENKEYLTIKCKFPNNINNISNTGDFALCRKDGIYSDNRHPDNVTISNIYNDLSRRDFTINAMALELDSNFKLQDKSKVIDFFGGQKDLENKIIRCVNKAQDRFTEDSLRLLRAIRFSVQLDFTLDKEIIDCLNNNKFYKLLDNVSTERKLLEIKKMFNSNTIKTLLLLKKLPDELYDYLFSNNIWLCATNKKI